MLLPSTTSSVGACSTAAARHHLLHVAHRAPSPPGNAICRPPFRAAARHHLLHVAHRAPSPPGNGICRRHCGKPTTQHRLLRAALCSAVAAEHHLIHSTHSHHHCFLSHHPLSGVVILLTLEFPCEDRASHCREAELLLAVERFTFDVVDLDCLRDLSRQRFSE